MKKDHFGRARVLSTAELDLLLEALPENHRVLATLLRRTAARVSEGLQLKWRYVADGYVLLTAPTTKGKEDKIRSNPSTTCSRVSSLEASGESRERSRSMALPWS